MNQGTLRVSSKDAFPALLRGCVAVAAVLLAVRFAFYLLATPKFVSDDESYLLLTLKHYFGGETLYTQVFTQYGPFYFLLQKAVFGLLRLPVTFDAGRLVAGIYWVLAAVLGGVFVFRVTKSVTFASAASLAVMWLERIVAFEPNHPEEVILALLMLGCCAVLLTGAAIWSLLGAVGTALLFIKPNIGIFFLAAAAIAGVCVLPAGRLRRVGSKVLLAATVLGPIVLMHQYLRAWSAGFCLIGILAAASTVLWGERGAVSLPNGTKILRHLAFSVVLTAVLITLAILLQGVTPAALLNVVVLGPLHQAEVFVIPFVVTPKRQLLAVLLALGVAGLCWYRERGCANSVWIHALKCLAGVAGIWVFIQRSVAYTSPPSFSYSFAPLYALLPLVLLPVLRGRWEVSEFLPRVFVAALAAMQILQAYSVAGSQVNIGAAPFLLWAFVCLYDGTAGVSGIFSSCAKPGHALHRIAASAATVVGGVLIVVLATVMLRTGIWHLRYATPASSLAGSRFMHLPNDLEANYIQLSSDVRANCQMLFEMPGMGSFNLWSGVPTPDGFNEDNWMRGVPLSEQQHTLQLLENDPDACVIYRPIMMGVWGVPDAGIDSLPLAHYILHDMPTVYTRDGYEIRVSPQRRAPWVEQHPTAAR